MLKNGCVSSKEIRQEGQEKKKDSYSSQYCYLISFNKMELSKGEFFPMYLEYSLSNQCSNEDNYI